MKLGALFPNFKAWSNFRLMVVIGSVVTIAPLAIGAVVVQAALSDEDPAVNRSTRFEARPDTNEGEAEGVPQAAAEPGVPPVSDPRAQPAPPLVTGESFVVTCPVNPASTENVCGLQSIEGFAGRVNLECAGLPANLRCTFGPSTVSARPNVTTPFTLALSTDRVVPGEYTFQVIGRSGTQVSRYEYPWRLSAPRVALAQPANNAPPPAPGAPPAPPPPDDPAPLSRAAAASEPTFSFTCGALTEGNKLVWSLSKDGGSTAKIRCFLTPLNGFNEQVTFKENLPANLAKPDTATFMLDQLQTKKMFDMNFEFSDAVRGLPADQLKAGRDYVVEITGTSESGKSLTRQVTMTVVE